MAVKALGGATYLLRVMEQAAPAYLVRLEIGCLITKVLLLET